MLNSRRLTRMNYLVFVVVCFCASSTVEAQEKTSNGIRIRDPFRDVSIEQSVDAAQKSVDESIGAASKQTSEMLTKMVDRASDSRSAAAEFVANVSKGNVANNPDDSAPTTHVLNSIENDTSELVSTSNAQFVDPNMIFSPAASPVSNQQMVQNVFASESYGSTAAPFAFSSAEQKSNYYGQDGCTCDKWNGFCTCGHCGNDLGLDIFRRGRLHQKKGTACSDGSCGTSDCNGVFSDGFFGKTRPSFGMKK
ncbi:MAG: hypothetical protein R3C03_00580 [Pirellulaceae bacterium]